MEIKKLVSIANKLDNLGLTKEADILDSFLEKVAEDGGKKPYVPAYSRIMSGGEVDAQREVRERLQGIKAPTLSGEPATPRRLLYHGPAEAGFPAGKPYYAAKPTTINQFKEFLSAILKEAGYDYKLLQNGKWDIRADQIAAAFQKFAELAGSPEAAKSWKDWAPNNGYTANIQGILDFWDKNVEKVYITHIAPKVIQEIKEERLKQLKNLQPTKVTDSIPSTVDSGQETMVAPPFSARSKDEIIKEIKSTGYRGYKITNASTLSLGVNKINFLTSKDGEQKTTMLTQQGPDAIYGGSAVKSMAPGSTETRTTSNRVKDIIMQADIGSTMPSLYGNNTRTSSTKVRIREEIVIWDPKNPERKYHPVAGAFDINLDSIGSVGRGGLLEVTLTDDLLKDLIAKKINNRSPLIKVDGQYLSGKTTLDPISANMIEFHD